jgi:hypothetical protein
MRAGSLEDDAWTDGGRKKARFPIWSKREKKRAK